MAPDSPILCVQLNAIKYLLITSVFRDHQHQCSLTYKSYSYHAGDRIYAVQGPDSRSKHTTIFIMSFL